MKKRILMVLMVLVLAASFIYAENNVLFATVTPFASQRVETSWDTESVSDYGWGATVGYRRLVGPVLFGADLAYQGYLQPTAKHVVTNVQLVGKVGGKIILSENGDLNLDFGAGVQMAVLKNVINFLPVVSGSCSLSTYVKPNMAVVSGVDLSVTWPKTADSSYKASVWNLGINFGLEYDF